VLATYAACYAEFRAAPAELMRPAAPAQGKRVLLERVTFLWKRMSFSQKATFRNLFRYKKRFFMTIFGIGACMGLLLVAFGLRNSISEIVDKQYTTVWTYDTSVSVDSDHPEKLQKVEQALDETAGVAEHLTVKQNNIDAENAGVTKSVYLFVPEETDNLDDFVRLNSRTTKEHYELDDEGVIITEKLARLLDVKAGGEITLKHDETEAKTVKVAAVAENYLHHYVYMTPALYQKTFGEAPDYSAVFLRTDNSDEEALGRTLLSIDGVTGVSFVSDLQSQVADMMKSLDMVVLVLVISAGMLAFIVLYNLNNISIIERRRELATLKVLGFYDSGLRLPRKRLADVHRHGAGHGHRLLPAQVHHPHLRGGHDHVRAEHPVHELRLEHAADPAVCSDRQLPHVLEAQEDRHGGKPEEHRINDKERGRCCKQRPPSLVCPFCFGKWDFPMQNSPLELSPSPFSFSTRSRQSLPGDARFFHPSAHKKRMKPNAPSVPETAYLLFSREPPGEFEMAAALSTFLPIPATCAPRRFPLLVDARRGRSPFAFLPQAGACTPPRSDFSIRQRTKNG